MAETISATSPSVFPKGTRNLSNCASILSRPNSTQRTQNHVQVPASNSEENDVEQISKRRQPKSRNGCITCKAKRMKCDEVKPSCQQCSRRRIVCGGYAKDIRWKHISKPMHFRAPIDVTRLPDDSSEQSHQSAISGLSDERIRMAGNERDLSINHPTTHSSPNLGRHRTGSSSANSPVVHAQFQTTDPTTVLVEEVESSDAHAHDSGMFDDCEARLGDISQSVKLDIPNFSASPSWYFDDLDIFLSGAEEEVADYDHGSPQLIDLILPNTDIDTVSSAPRNGDTDNPKKVITLVIDREEQITDAATDQTPELHSSIETWVTSLELQSLRSGATDGKELYPFYQHPPFSNGSPEMISSLFDHQTCKILSIKEESSINPWRTLIWPLATDCPPLYHAIAAMTCLHMCRTNLQLRDLGIEHFRLSTQGLAANTGGSNKCLDSTLAARLALAFAEMWDHRKSSTGTTHIKAAKTLLKQAISKKRTSGLTVGELSRLSFLANTWTYMDVIARFTSMSNGTSIDLEFMTACSVLSPIPRELQFDPLMGCAITLFPTIGRVADIVGRIRQRGTKSNNATIISEAVEIKVVIENWVPPVDLQRSGTSTNIFDPIQTAEAYRWATLLLLHQAVPELPCLFSLGELAQKVMVYLATVSLTSRVTIVQIFPLMAAGCEALEEEDRGWVRERWGVMSRHMITGIVDRCKRVTEEVWRRRDEYEACCGLLHISGATQPSVSMTSPKGGIGMDVSSIYDTPSSLKVGFNEGGKDSTECWCGAKKSSRSKAHEFPISTSYKRNLDAGMTGRYTDYAVNGKLHWLRVMKDWGWEVMLG